MLEPIENAQQLCGSTYGADDLIPLLIYLTIRVNPPHIYSNLQYVLSLSLSLTIAILLIFGMTNLYALALMHRYVTNFRYEDALASEAGYVLVTFSAVVSFIESLAVPLSDLGNDFDDSLSGCPTDVSPPTSESPEDRGALLELRDAGGSTSTLPSLPSLSRSSSAATLPRYPSSHSFDQTVLERGQQAQADDSLHRSSPRSPSSFSASHKCSCNHCQGKDLSFVPGGSWVDPYPPLQRAAAFPFPASTTTTHFASSSFPAAVSSSSSLLSSSSSSSSSSSFAFNVPESVF